MFSKLYPESSQTDLSLYYFKIAGFLIINRIGSVYQWDICNTFATSLLSDVAETKSHVSSFVFLAGCIYELSHDDILFID